MAEGKVYLALTDKKYAWLSQNDDPTTYVYLHYTQLPEVATAPLIEGEPVEYDIVSAEGRPQAVRVKRLDTDYRSKVTRLKGVVKSFEHGHGKIEEEDGSEIFIHYSQILGVGRAMKLLHEGEDVEYESGREGGRPQALRVKRLDPRPPLERFAALGRIEDRTSQLMEAAQREHGNWEYQHTESRWPRPILRSYLYFTFARLQQEGKIATTTKDGRRYACFNTGLVSGHQEDIIALCVPNRAKDPEWSLDGFYRECDHRLIGIFRELPPVANYFDDPSELLYDRRYDLFIDIDHVMQRRERFPEPFASNVHMLRNTLAAAKELIKKRAYRNYKTAVPQFNRGKIQLLLPLCLLTPEKADLALVVERAGQAYRGNTVLTLDMAYNNARLLARPDNEWLQP